MKPQHIFAALLIALFAGMIFTAGCYYDKEEEIHPVVGSTSCDTSGTMSYANNVVPILTNYCYSCHAGAHSSSGFQLDTYSTLSTYAGNGQLMGDIRHDPGFNPMPQSGGQLAPCEIATIQKWVDNGFPNN